MPHDRNDHYWNDHFWSFGSQCCLPNRTSRLCCVLMLLPFFFYIHNHAMSYARTDIEVTF